MTTFHDVPAGVLIQGVSAKLAVMDTISQPEWARHVKTGIHRERPPVQEDWWEVRAAAVLRKVGTMSPVGVNHLAQEFGGSRDRGSNPNRAKAGSRHIIRTILQQLEDAKLVVLATNLPGTVKLGRTLTPAGQKLLNKVAHEVRPAVEAEAPGLAKY